MTRCRSRCWPCLHLSGAVHSRRLLRRIRGVSVQGHARKGGPWRFSAFGRSWDRVFAQGPRKRSGRPLQPDLRCHVSNRRLRDRFSHPPAGLPAEIHTYPSSRGKFVATREFFAQNFRKAVTQRSRWVTGIWVAILGKTRFPAILWSQFYWFWRDRKGLVANILTPLTNAVCLYGIVTWVIASIHHHPWGLGVQLPAAWLRKLGWSPLSWSCRRPRLGYTAPRSSMAGSSPPWFLFVFPGLISSTVVPHSRPFGIT